MRKDILTRPSNIIAKVVADSISKSGQRITTLEIEYPRFILAEMNTHSMLSKNSASSRAIPINKMFDKLNAVPLYWGSKQSGMQAGEEIDDRIDIADYLAGEYHCDAAKLTAWDIGKDQAVILAKAFDDAGYHKQVVNRLTEPFQMMKTVVTATEWDNFFHLRLHPDAQPEFIRLAYEMYKAIKNSIPLLLNDDDWHLPYVFQNIVKHRGEIGYFDLEGKEITKEEAIQISISCCAQVSYRKLDDTTEAAERIFNRLVNADVLHASPMEHVCKPMTKTEFVTSMDEFGFEVFNVENSVNIANESDTWENGISHVDRDRNLWSGQMKGWIQYRKTMMFENCTGFDFNERMKLFED